MFWFDGNPKGISWAIQTEDSLVEQRRDHADIFLDKVTSEQSRYIALHVGLFWGIGTFIVKNKDEIDVNIDSKSMYEHLTRNNSNQDSFIETRTGFIKKLIEQRILKINYQLIETKENFAVKLLQKRNET